MRRRRLLTNLAATEAATGHLVAGPLDQAALGEVLAARPRDAMLAIGQLSEPPPGRKHLELDRAAVDVHLCSYVVLTHRLPGLSAPATPTPDPTRAAPRWPRPYLLAPQVLVEVEENELGWMAANRCRNLAAGVDSPPKRHGTSPCWCAGPAGAGRQCRSP
ncbi:hypothetical protein [Streptomyces sp. NPDC127098]|uniref:hypothetical protein n=1 Tax=Streptomyces sp. NPDC127098 TaxID=3347137 RepID=UPI00365E7846